MSEHIDFLFCVANIAAIWLNVILITRRVRKAEEALALVKP